MAHPRDLCAQSYRNITTQTTTVVKTGEGRLHGVIVGTPVANGTVTLYDNTSATGTPISIVTTAGTVTQINVPFNVKFSTGLTVVTAAQNQNVTILYS